MGLLSYVANRLMTYRVIKPLPAEPAHLPDRNYLYLINLLVIELGLVVILLPYFQFLNNDFFTEKCVT